jgi:hypothetical protein
MPVNGIPNSPKISPAQEVELQTMAHEDDSAADAPLIQNTQESDERQPIEASDEDSSTGNLFVYALTFSAGISGLLFGYEFVFFSSCVAKLLTPCKHWSYILNPRLHRVRLITSRAVYLRQELDNILH